MTEPDDYDILRLHSDEPRWSWVAQIASIKSPPFELPPSSSIEVPPDFDPNDYADEIPLDEFVHNIKSVAKNIRAWCKMERYEVITEVTDILTMTAEELIKIQRMRHITYWQVGIWVGEIKSEIMYEQRAQRATSRLLGHQANTSQIVFDEGL